MAKGLKKIIRFHQSLIDEKRKVLGDFLNQASICDKQRQDFKANIKAEQDNLSNTPNMVAMFYGSYVASTYQKIKEIEVKIEELEVSIKNTQQEIIILFKEKRFLKLHKTTMKNKLLKMS